jgi:anti-anti-sigma factor
MDSSGVASLVKLLSRVRRSSAALKLCGLTDRVRGVFEITRLDSVFEIYGGEDEALA